MNQLYEKGHIYGYQYQEELEQYPDLIKIGCAKDVNKRLHQWQAQDGKTPILVFYVECSNYINVEKQVHKYYADQNIKRLIQNGKYQRLRIQWFQFTKINIIAILQKVKEIANQLGSSGQTYVNDKWQVNNHKIVKRSRFSQQLLQNGYVIGLFSSQTPDLAKICFSKHEKDIQKKREQGLVVLFKIQSYQYQQIGLQLKSSFKSVLIQRNGGHTKQRWHYIQNKEKLLQILKSIQMKCQQKKQTETKTKSKTNNPSYVKTYQSIGTQTEYPTKLDRIYQAIQKLESDTKLLKAMIHDYINNS